MEPPTRAATAQSPDIEFAFTAEVLYSAISVFVLSISSRGLAPTAP